MLRRYTKTMVRLEHPLQEEAPRRLGLEGGGILGQLRTQRGRSAKEKK